MQCDWPENVPECNSVLIAEKQLEKDPECPDDRNPTINPSDEDCAKYYVCSLGVRYDFVSY